MLISIFRGAFAQWLGVGLAIAHLFPLTGHLTEIVLREMKVFEALLTMVMTTVPGEVSLKRSVRLVPLFLQLSALICVKK